MTSKIIKEWIREFLEIPEEVDFSVEANQNLDFGEYASNVALVMSKKVSKNPKELAEEYLKVLNQNLLNQVSVGQVAGPGFLNFFLKKEYIRDVLKKTQTGADLPADLKGQKIFIEHTQPNPFKEFHIGHLMNNAIGESITRLTKTLGAEVKVATYHGDVGLHVARAIWGKLKQSKATWGEAYSLGSATVHDFTFNLDLVNFFKNRNIKDDQKEIVDINKKIYDQSDEKINNLYKEGKEQSFKYFEEVYKRLGSEFDFHFLESESGEIGRKIVGENIGKVFEKGDGGAVVFRGENFTPKTHTRVFLNSDGLPTYEAKEVGLAFIKKEKFDYDKSITITANEQDSFFDVVEVAIGEVMPDRKGKLVHLSHGMLKLPEGKMSSRTGNVITAESLINQVKERVLEKMVGREFGDEKKSEIALNSPKGESSEHLSKKDVIAEIVAIGAIKYSILKQSIGSDIIFDFDKSLSFEGDSGPYLQYSAVRANSVLKKASEAGLKSDSEIPTDWQSTKLEKLLERFYSVIERAGLEYAPQFISTYLIELAGEFNSFYAKEKIADSEDSNSPYKLFLTEVFRETIQSGLWLLGIKTPSEM